MKKVLIVTYYWPPAGGSGVQRFLYFTRYFREFGWEPTIYTMKNPDYPVVDEKLIKKVPFDIEVIKESGWEPFSIYRRITGKKKNEGLPNNLARTKGGFLHRLAVWIRGNFFIPDARVFWVKPSIKFLKNYLSNNHVDAIISTGPPHSTHLIAMELAEKFHLPWVADFRDPWTKISYYDSLGLTYLADKKHKALERKVLRKASRVTTVTKRWKQDLESLGERDVDFVPNGFEEGAVKITSTKKETKILNILYVGVLSDDRSPLNFWKAVGKVVDQNNYDFDLRIIFVGDIAEGVKRDLQNCGILSICEFKGYVNYTGLSEFYSLADLLLLVGIPGEKGVLPAKVFEYAQTKVPVFGIGEHGGEMGDLIHDLNLGCYVDFEDEKRIHSTLEKLFGLFEERRLIKYFSPDMKGLSEFSRKKLTGRLVELMESEMKKISEVS